ncbi:hypothetical protein ACFS7Y_16295 [Sphingobacterium bambusae]|uniref:IS256 family transposase n=1 Tax=Sphingobacterium bambusae TaxID=662858 RepID=A0ABW6BHD9_9SPHI|nr:hypothetical protein [Sphingobacterium bambusae]WPL49257.1 hypothetical protein SCB77_02140 [Sphingobacterium bambusae]
MEKEKYITDDLLSQFSNGEELFSFLGELQTRGIEKLLEAELDGHLDYQKNEKSDNPNFRNGLQKRRSSPSLGSRRSRFPETVMLHLTRSL